MDFEELPRCIEHIGLGIMSVGRVKFDAVGESAPQEPGREVDPIACWINSVHAEAPKLPPDVVRLTVSAHQATKQGQVVRTAISLDHVDTLLRRGSPHQGTPTSISPRCIDTPRRHRRVAKGGPDRPLAELRTGIDRHRGERRRLGPCRGAALKATLLIRARLHGAPVSSAQELFR